MSGQTTQGRIDAIMAAGFTQVEAVALVAAEDQLLEMDDDPEAGTRCPACGGSVKHDLDTGECWCPQCENAESSVDNADENIILAAGHDGW